MKMVRLGLPYIWFYCGLLSSSTSDANKLIVGRAEAETGHEKRLDFFSYTDESSCGFTNDVTSWCNQRNADALTTLTSQYKCSCQCKWDKETFLLDDEKRCVNKSYLRNRFGNGTFILFPAINLTIDSHLDTYMGCRNCQVTSVKYHQANNTWKEIGSKGWNISNNGRLTWKAYSVDEVNGKILKILIRKRRHGHRCENYSMFCKSKGKTVTLTPTISILISPTVYPTSTTSIIVIRSPTPTAIKMISYTVTTTSITSAVISSTVDSTPVAIPSAYASQPPKEDRHKADEAGSPIGAIVGAVIACIIVIIILVIFIIWKQRRKNSRPRKSTKVATDSTGNPMYLHNQGETIAIPHRKVNASNVIGNEEYDYASVDGGPSDHQKTSIPLYQSLIKDNVRDSVYTPLSKEGLDSTPMDYLYNHLQHPQYNPPRSKSDPLYNTLEPPNNDEYMEPETQISDNQPGGPQPVYNVLEGPDTNPAPQDNDPVYNVLEDPNANQYPQDNDPVYNVLEGPDDDYDNAPSEDDENLPASGQDNVAYSSTIDLRKAQSPSSPDYDVLEGPEGALQDSMYQPLGVRAQDDVYQPLDRTSQPIYQSLEPNDSMA